MTPVTAVKTNPNSAPESRVLLVERPLRQHRQNRRQETERVSASQRVYLNSSNQTSITNLQEVC